MYQRLNEGEWSFVKTIPSNVSLSTGVGDTDATGVCTWLYPNAPLPPSDGWIKYPGRDMGGNDIGCSWMPIADYTNLQKLKDDTLKRNGVGFIKVKYRGNNNTFFYNRLYTEGGGGC